MTRGLSAAADLIRRFCPKFRLVAKSDSRAMRLLGWLSPATRDYFTTVGFTCYYPDKALTDPDLWRVVFHEGTHALRAARWTRPVFAAAYLFPWSLVPLFLGLAFWHYWLFLGAFLGAVPRVAYWRTAIELEGYRVNMLIDYWRGGANALADVSWYALQLYGATYDDCTTRARATRLVNAAAVHVMATQGDVSGDTYLSVVKEFLLKSGSCATG